MTRDKTAPLNPDMSVEVDDVDAAYAAMQESGAEIVHPLQDEEWVGAAVLRPRPQRPRGQRAEPPLMPFPRHGDMAAACGPLTRAPTQSSLLRVDWRQGRVKSTHPASR
jgi:hypothetical protein